MQENQEDRSVKRLFRGMFKQADRKLARKLERQGEQERAAKVRQLAKDSPVAYSATRRK